METESPLVDLLDRVLDKGLVIQADLLICVAGIPLVAVNLRAALAGVETFLEHGSMVEWDRQVREQARQRHGKSRQPGLLKQEGNRVAVLAGAS